MAVPRSSIIGWVVVALVAVAGVAAVVWALQERAEAEADQARAEKAAAERQSDVDALEEELADKTAEVEGLADRVQRCVDSLDEHLAAYDDFHGELRQAGPGDVSRLADEAASLVQRARAAVSCETGGDGETV